MFLNMNNSHDVAYQTTHGLIKTGLIMNFVKLVVSPIKTISPIMNRAFIFMMLIAASSVMPSHAEGLKGVPGSWTEGFNLEEKAGDRWDFNVSPYSVHFSSSPDHKYVWLVGVERERSDGTITGAAYFSNSFGQPTGYFYPWGGVSKNILGIEHLYAKWTAGLLYGYKAPFEDKVPFNNNGFSPAIVPAVGYELAGGNKVQLNLFGAAGLMFQFSAPIK